MVAFIIRVDGCCIGRSVAGKQNNARKGMVYMRTEKNENFEKIEENLPQLLSHFSVSNALEEDVAFIGRFTAALMSVRRVALVQFAGGKTAVWHSLGRQEEKHLSSLLLANVELLIGLTDANGIGQGTEISELLELDKDTLVLLCVVYYDGKPCGFLLVERDAGAWSEVEIKRIRLLSGMMGATFAIRASLENEKRSNFVFNTVLDDMKASIYITEVDTDRILFMNQTMKDVFGLENPEGQICWQVLQRGMKQRCPFCPVDKLKQNPMGTPVFQWDEINTITRRSYRNYDSLIRWMDGSIVHLQQSIDVTELKSANTDELTMLMTRRSGKNALRATLEHAHLKKKIITVCLYDINLLKEVNDLYGHAEGDKMIVTIADTVREVLQEREYAFRLSGDEFVVVFDAGWKDAQRRLNKALKRLHVIAADYKMGFCYGLVEVSQSQSISVEEALFLADTRMYEQKRQFHILRNRQRSSTLDSGADADTFTYAQERLYDALVQSTDDYIYVCNMKTGIFRYTRAMVEEFDLPGEIIENAAAVWGAKVHQNDRAAFLESNQEIADGRADSHCVEYRAQNRRGEWVWVRCRGHLELDDNGEPVLFAGFITNLGKKNMIDHLTGLFNKLEFENQIQRLIETDPNRKFGLMILGIDDLKHINDLYNRAFGDEVIRIASQRIQMLLPSDTSIYRLDGDEFGIISLDADLVKMQKLYRAIHHSFENQQEYDNRKFYSTFSAGCLFYPQDTDNFLDLMKYAGYSLEYAKSHGKKCCIFFSPEILGHRNRALAMLEALRESVENDFEGFSLRFQPVVEANSGQLLGIEALARWQCEQFGAVSPIEFIPLLEESGMIIPVGKWVFRMALRTCKQWQKDKPDLTLDVNLSYLQLEGSDFVPFLREVLAAEEYLAQNLVVELTESYFAKENQRVQVIFEELRAMGVRIAMDDFGTGYSTLGILKGAPADIVKIDKTFIRDIRTSNFDATFIRFVVALCHDVGIKVCLEGVETEAEYQAVNQMGLDMIQGFLFGHPLTEREFSLKYAGGKFKN